MANKHAQVLDAEAFQDIMLYVSKGKSPLRDQAMILLSYKAGLRAQEIAGIQWKDVCDFRGDVREDHFFVPSSIAKNNREATIPMHAQLYIVLCALRKERPDDEYIIYPTRKTTYEDGMTPNAVVKWFDALYKEHNMRGCSSHSGRRTFITQLSRKAGLFDCSIKDVQILARHAHLGTTESYIEPSKTIGNLVGAI